MQVKLLRVLQEHEVVPLGSNTAVPIDVRIVATTNRRLREEVDARRFREDLYYRLGVVEIVVPPLRDRFEDLPELADHLLVQAAARTGRPKPKLSRAAIAALLDREWPGNVRELDNVLTKAVLLADADVVDPEALQLGPPARPQNRAQHERHEHGRLLTVLRSTG
jgi:DNA-binding NtrC family response regulator